MISLGCRISLAVLSAALFLHGCAAREMTLDDWRDPQVSVAWPEAPLPARVEYLRMITTESELRGDKQGNRILDWLLGERSDQQPLVSPYGLTADGEGRIWVADPGSGLVKMYDLGRREVDYLGQAGDVFLVSPVDVGYDLDRERLYVSDSNLKQVLVFDREGRYLSRIAPAEGFGRPGGLAVAGDGRLFVTDVVRGIVEVFGPTGNHLETVGSAAAADGLFRRPSNIAVDAEGRLYIVDSLRFRVEVQGADGELITIFGQVGDRPGSFARPRGIAVDSFGHIYVADAAFDNIQIFDLTGQLLMYFGSPGAGPGNLCLPAGLYIDRNNRIYVAEACNHRAQIFQYKGIEAK